LILTSTKYIKHEARIKSKVCGRNRSCLIGGLAGRTVEWKVEVHEAIYLLYHSFIVMLQLHCRLVYRSFA